MKKKIYTKHLWMRAAMMLLVALFTNASAWAQFVFIYAQPNSAATVKVGTSLVLDEFVDGAGFTMATPGETVYFGYSAYDDYEFKKIRCDNLTDSDITKVSDNIYSFTMPDGVDFLTIWMDFEYVGGSVEITGVDINEENFPDANFRNWLLSQSYGKDAVITDTEMAGITKIVARSCGIEDLTGIEHFTALAELYVDNNLETPEEERNKISSIDLSGNTFLRTLYCDNNKITSLNLLNNSNLTNLNCGGNLLTQLNVTANTKLQILACSDNKLGSLDVTTNQELALLLCSGNNLSTLNVTNNLLIEQLYCDNNQLTELDVSNQNLLTILNCNDNLLSSLEVNSNKLYQLYCYNNQIKGQAMDALVNSLPEYQYAYMVILDLESETEQNAITKEQADVAKSKGWSVEGISGEDFYPLSFGDEHEYVDLGLTSGTLWATCNVGANKPLDAGLFFAWGDTEGHGSDPSDGYLFNWENYKWAEVVGEETVFTKYCTDSSRGKDGVTDGKYELDPEDDAAYVNWGIQWRTPSVQQWQELKDECTWTLTTIGDVNGYEVVGTNGNSIFLPETRWRIDDMLLDGGAYWSRSFNPTDMAGAYYFGWDEWGEYEYGGWVDGQCVRPVVNTNKYIKLADNAVNGETIATAAASDDTYEVKLEGRTLYKDGEWNTLCLPFDLSEEQLSDYPLAGADIRTLTQASVTGHHVDLTFGGSVSSLTAGTPYIVRWEADTKIPTIIDPVFRNVTISEATNSFTSADGHVNFIGYYDAFPITPYDNPLIYYLTSGNILQYTAKERTLKACRAYFTFTPNEGSSANDFSFDIHFGQSHDTIQQAKWDEDKEEGGWFDLNGRRLSGKPTQKGIYVTKGQKVVIQ